MTLNYGATATHSEYVLLITFTRQQWLIRGYNHKLRICIIITFTRQKWLIRGYSHTLRICITYYFYTATMVNTVLQPHTQNTYYLLLLHGNSG